MSQLWYPIRFYSHDIEKIKQKSQKVIDLAHKKYFNEANSYYETTLEMIKKDYPKATFNGLTSDKLEKLTVMYHNGCKFIFESFDYIKERQKMSDYVNQKRNEGYRIFNAVTNDKVANIILYKPREQ